MGLFFLLVRLYIWEVDSGGFLEDSKNLQVCLFEKPDLPLLLL